IREELGRFQTVRPCPQCGGYRLKAEGLAVKINKMHIGEIAEMPIAAAHELFLGMHDTLDKKRQKIAERILKEICERLTFLVDVGLDYLTLSRASGSLSGGESQRIRLASQIGSGLMGVLYVLDEPSIGLHQRDNARLLQTLQHLRDLGNTVLVVEHDEEAIRAADYLVDMGPGAGVFGGEVVSAGTPEEVFRANAGLTAKYITGELEISIPTKRRAGNGFHLSLRGATGNNLQNVSLDIPLGTFCCVSGVSGSGKSTLIFETLYRAAAKQILRTKDNPAPYEALSGLEYLDKVIDIDQAPIGRTPRSNPATYTGAFGPIREWFAALPEAKARGYGPGRFSFNVKGGRCEACQGDGVIKIEMHFLPDVYVPCDQCQGKRYNRETLAVTYRGKTIHDVLEMTIAEATEFFQAMPNIRDKLATLCKVGLHYIKTGQSATTLSGGEAQRVKLAKELSRKATGRTLYILDEPTTGLHFEDVRRLLEVLQALVDAGNTVLVIEHNLDVIKSADWLFDMGPDGGDKGGMLIAEGTPEDVAKIFTSHTGQYLHSMLSRAKSNAKQRLRKKAS
ncbi:MAG: excinuclease ABC subunit UvrA, partial [Pseudomonadota bacterium]